MKKDKIIFSVIIILILAIITVFTVVASTNVLDYSNSNSIESQIENEYKEFKKTSNTNENYIKSFCNKYYKQKTLSYDEYNELVSYIIFLTENNFSKHEMKYFENLIDSGTSLNGLMSVYHFWTTTNEDFEMIGMLCEYEYRYSGDHWVENAFNTITDNKTGVLTGDDIQIYYDKGLTYDDIYTANVLCRKGKYTINELLERRLNGKSWDALIKDVDNIEVPAVYKDGQKKLKASKVKKKYDKLDLDTITDDEFYEKISEIENEYYTHANEQVVKTLTSFKVFKEDISTNDKFKRDEKYRNEAIVNGMSSLEIDSLEYRGYSLEDICMASKSEDYLLSLKELILERRK